MIVNDKDALARLNSPMNLFNRLKAATDNSKTPRASAMGLFGLNKNGERERTGVSFNSSNKKAEANKETDTTAQETTQILERHSEGVKIGDILSNAESQIKLTQAHDRALELLNNSVAELSLKLSEVPAAKLPGVIAAASKTVESIRKERNEAARSNKDREVHFHFYTPEQKKLNDYTVIDVPA